MLVKDREGCFLKEAVRMEKHRGSVCVCVFMGWWEDGWGRV
jgi:hypothetical protein